MGELTRVLTAATIKPWLGQTVIAIPHHQQACCSLLPTGTPLPGQVYVFVQWIHDTSQFLSQVHCPPLGLCDKMEPERRPHPISSQLQANSVAILGDTETQGLGPFEKESEAGKPGKWFYFWVVLGGDQWCLLCIDPSWFQSSSGMVLCPVASRKLLGVVGTT